MLNVWIWIVAFLEVIQLGHGVAPDKSNYCLRKFNCGELQHLRCKFKKQMESALCSSITDDTTPQVRKALLIWMNNYRQRTAAGKTVFNGTVANMRQLTWDHKLEEFALVVATQCPKPLIFNSLVNDSCAGTKEFINGTRAVHYGVSRYEDVNHFIEELKGVEIPDDVIDNYSSPNATVLTESQSQADGGGGGFPSPFDPEGYPSHTRVLWANSHKVGCSIVTCDCRLSGFFRSEAHLVCFFGPKPNIIGEPVFERGPPCSDCPNGTDCSKTSKWYKLCAKPDDPSKPEEVEGIAFPPVKNQPDDYSFVVDEDYYTEDGTPKDKKARRISSASMPLRSNLIVCSSFLFLKVTVRW